MSSIFHSLPGHVFRLGLNKGGLRIGVGYSEEYVFLGDTLAVAQPFDQALLPSAQNPALREDLPLLVASQKELLIEEVPLQTWMLLDHLSLHRVQEFIEGEILKINYETGAHHEKGEVLTSESDQVLLISVSCEHGFRYSIFADRLKILGVSSTEVGNAFTAGTFAGAGGHGYFRSPLNTIRLIHGQNIRATVVPRVAWMELEYSDIVMVQQLLKSLSIDLADGGFLREQDPGTSPEA